jgi:hypothetical protein
MNLSLPRYREVKNKYCIGYFGPCNEYITLLLGLRNQVEKQLPGLQLYIGCTDALCNGDRMVPESAVRQMTREPWGTHFGHIRELRCDMVHHPVEQFFKESNVQILPAERKQDEGNRIVHLVTQGTSPTRSIGPKQTQELKDFFKSEGYVVRTEGSVHEAGMVCGVESVELWSAAFAGKDCVLVNTGLGSDFFRVICPWGQVISDRAA